MKQLITKSDGTPTKSKVLALQFLEKNNIPKEALIAENGQFYYETEEEAKEVIEPEKPKAASKAKAPEKVEQNVFEPVSWETEVYNQNNEHTQLFIPSTDVTAILVGKYPAGQGGRAKSAIEVSIDGENFIMSVELLSKIFKVRG